MGTDKIIIRDGVVYVCRLMETLPDFPQAYRNVIALKIEDVKKAIEQIEEADNG